MDDILETTVQDGQEVPEDTTTVVLEEEVDMTPIEEDPFDGTAIEEPSGGVFVDTADEPLVTDTTSTEEDTREDPPVIEEEDKELPKEEPIPPKHRQRYMWCLDNGHGKLQAGKRSVCLLYTSPSPRDS